MSKERRRRSEKTTSNDVHIEEQYNETPIEGGELSASRKVDSEQQLPKFPNKATTNTPRPGIIKREPEPHMWGGQLNSAKVEQSGKTLPSFPARATTQKSVGIIGRNNTNGVYGGMIEPSVVTAEKPEPSQDGGVIRGSYKEAYGKELPKFPNKATTTNRATIIKNPTYAEVLEPAIVMAEMPSKDGGMLEASRISAEKSMPTFENKAKELNPSGVITRRQEETPEYGGELQASKKVDDAKGLPTFPNQATALKQGAGIINREPETSKYGGQLEASKKEESASAMPTFENKAEALNKVGISEQRYNRERYEAPDYEEEDIATTSGEEEPSQDGGTLEASHKETDEKAMPEFENKAVQMNPAGISTKRFHTQYQPSEEEPTEEEQDDESKKIVDNLGNLIKEAEDEIKRSKENDEVSRKRQRNVRLIAGISDALSSLANLIGVSKGASNIQVASALDPLTERLDMLRKEDAAAAKDRRDRLDKLLKEEREMKLQYARDEESRRRWEKDFAFREGKEKTDNERWQKNFDAQEQERERKAGQWEKDHELRREQIANEADLAKKRYEEAVRHNKASEAASYRSYALAMQKFNEEKRGNEYPVNIGDETLKISKYDITAGSIDPLFNALPAEYQALALSDKTEKVDPLTGEVTYSKNTPPSLEAKLGAIATAAQNDKALANKLRVMAGQKPKEEPQTPKQGNDPFTEFE